MFPNRNRQPGPGFQPPNGRRMQQHPAPFRQSPQIPHPYQQMQRPMVQNRRQVPQGPQGFRGPFNQPQRQEMRPAKKEGLLSKILGKSKQKGASPNLFAPAASSNQSSSRSSGGGILETLKNPESLNNMLSNTQKVLQAAEQFTPMVEQYGPVIKNLPSMWKVFRSISSAGDNEDEGASVESEPNVEVQKNIEVKTDSKKREEAIEANPIAQVRTETKRERSSGPKLYI
ncbi:MULTISPECIES: YqfQ family protein [Peribacillus]|uniref:YqfQ family protein n=1 Tax=Peribacillus TaxID=2675229 RepID=UPI001F4D4F56|nr:MULTISPECIES: YqfQ family protein [unclassified Peribacillus]MCK1982137.1 YqfQ family protein [Peribacillus sp. Aquil_B1]MCK2007511.1 YqfQ family protein [Peribacillus sp. Aquil_B8]